MLVLLCTHSERVKSAPSIDLSFLFSDCVTDVDRDSITFVNAASNLDDAEITFSSVEVP